MAFSFARSDRSAPFRFAFPQAIGDRGLPRIAAPARDRTLLGVAAILASTIAFPLSDMAAQSLIPALPAIEVAWLRYVVFFLAALPLVFSGRRPLHTARPALQALRGTMAALSTLAAILSFCFLPVPETTAIGFVAPVMVTGLAILFLGEQVGIRRWAAAGAALLGVLIIVQPGGSSFCSAALIPLAGAAANAICVIATRSNTSDAPGVTIFYSTAIGVVLLTGLVAFTWTTPTLQQLQVALLVGLFGALGSLLQVLAYRLAPASLLAPFTYTQLIWAAVLSFVVLGTVPQPAMIVGGGIIALSAAYTAIRERARRVA